LPIVVCPVNRDMYKVYFVW